MAILYFLFLATLLYVIYIFSTREEMGKAKYGHTGVLEEYWSKNDRRRGKRFDTALDVKYKLLKSSKINLGTKSKNISEVGICISEYEILPVDCILHLEINIPTQKEPFAAKGKVTWCREAEHTDKNGRRSFKAGIEFLEMEEKQKEGLLNFLRSHFKAEDEKEL